MNAEEAFSTFLSGLTPHLQEHVGAHVQGDLEAAKRMALRMEMYWGTAEQSRGSNQGRQQGGQKGNKHKGNVHSVQAQTQIAGPSQVMAVQSGGQQKGKGKGKGNQQQQGFQPPKGCWACGGKHSFRKCPIWNEIRQKCGVEAKKQGNA